MLSIGRGDDMGFYEWFYGCDFHKVLYILNISMKGGTDVITLFIPLI